MSAGDAWLADPRRVRRNLLNMADAVVADYRANFGGYRYTEAERQSNLDAFLDGLGDDQ